MVSALDTKAAAAAIKAIAKAPRTATVVVGTSSYSETTGIEVQTGPITYTPDVSPAFGVDLSYVDGDTIRVGDSHFYVAASSSAGVALAFDPAPGQVWTMDGKAWRVVAVKRLPENGPTAAWEVFVRR